MRSCFPRLVDRFWQNLRRVAGYRVQYFAAVEPQHRLAPHLHAAIRGTIPRQVIKQVVGATYLQVWWPSFDTPVYVHRRPRWDGHDYVDPDTGRAPADLAGSPRPGRPRHPRARGAVREAARHGWDRRPIGRCGPGDPVSDEVPHQVHRRRLHTRPTMTTRHPIPAIWRTSTGCMPSCSTCPAVSGARTGSATASNPWMPDLAWLPGRCGGKAHDRDNLGLGGRRVLVSRQWSGKTLAEHRADRATVVREALEAAGMLAPEIERMAATVLAKDGKPRFVWTDTRPDAATYIRVILAAVAEQQRWRAQYQAAKEAAAPVDNRSAAPP